VTAGIMVARLVATCGSPTIGGVLYDAGGWGLPFFCSAVVFLIVFPGFYFFEASFPNFAKPNKETLSLWELLRIKDVIFMMITFISTLSVMYSFEPLYEPVLTAHPYDLSVSQVGTTFLIMWGSTVLSLPLIAGWLYNITGANFQQGLGFVVHVTGILLQGPSVVFGDMIGKSATQIFLGMGVTGLGSAFALPMQSYFMLRIVWKNAGIKKEDVGASIASGQLSFGMVAGAVAPPVGGALYGSMGFPGVTTAYGCFFAALYIVLFMRLLPYGEAPGWWKRQRELESGLDNIKEDAGAADSKDKTAPASAA